jgi:hypothetical protein
VFLSFVVRSGLSWKWRRGFGLEKMEDEQLNATVQCAEQKDRKQSRVVARCQASNSAGSCMRFDCQVQKDKF